MSLSFQIYVEPAVVVYSISGRIIQEENSAQLIDSLVEQLKSHKIIIYELSALEYITSSGLNFFIRSLTKTRNVGGEIYLCNLSPTVEKLFTISKLNEIFTIFPSLEEGLEKINAQKA